MNIAIPIALLFSLATVGAQETINSLDLASPPFTEQEKTLLFSTDGLYFFITTLGEEASRVVPSKLSGNSTVIEYNRNHAFYIGPQSVSWQIFYDRIGLDDFIEDYNQVRRKRDARHAIGLVGLLLGGSIGSAGLLMVAWSGGGEIAPYVALGGGAAMAIGSLILALNDPPFPPFPSGEDLAEASNLANRNKLP